jgi:hypothetical protein
MLSTGETYTNPGGDFFARRDPERTRQQQRFRGYVTAADRRKR